MKLVVGAKALIVNDGKALLLREVSCSEGTSFGKWDVPGGLIHDDKPLLDGLSSDHDLYEWVTLFDIANKEQVSNLE